ncbi:MAG: pirin family protein [Tangfeifania sp.]
MHPHRGFETITYLLKGFMYHPGSSGATVRYGYPDVHCMTAGSIFQLVRFYVSKKSENILKAFPAYFLLVFISANSSSI